MMASGVSAFLLTDLAGHLRARLVGRGEIVIRGVTTIDAARPDAVTWAQDERYLAQAWASSAAAVIAPARAAPPPDRAALLVEDVQAALNVALNLFAPPTPTVPPGMHPTAIVARSADVAGACIGPYVVIGERARVGRDSQLHAGVQVGEDAVIGPSCVLWPHVVVRERVTLGARVIIHANATIGADGFGYLLRDNHFEKVPHIGGVLIEDDVEVGANTTVDRGKCGDTIIRRGTKVDNLVQVAHNVTIGEDCVIAAQCGISGSSTLGHHVVLGGQVGIADHLRIGNGVQIGAQSGVSKNFEDGQVLFGSPATPLQETARRIGATRRLPEMITQLRDLRKRLERLEATANSSR